MIPRDNLPRGLFIASPCLAGTVCKSKTNLKGSFCLGVKAKDRARETWTPVSSVENRTSHPEAARREMLWYNALCATAANTILGYGQEEKNNIHKLFSQDAC